MKKPTKKKEIELSLIAYYIGSDRYNFYEEIKDVMFPQGIMDKIKKYSHIKIKTITNDDILYMFQEINNDLFSYDCYYINECTTKGLDFEKIKTYIEESIDESWHFLTEYARDNNKKIGVI